MPDIRGQEWWWKNFRKHLMHVDRYPVISGLTLTVVCTRRVPAFVLYLFQEHFCERRYQLRSGCQQVWREALMPT